MWQLMIPMLAQSEGDADAVAPTATLQNGSPDGTATPPGGGGGGLFGDGFLFLLLMIMVLMVVMTMAGGR